MNLLSNDTHHHLLRKLSGLSFGDLQSTIYENSLQELFGKYQEQLNGLFDTIKAYEEIAQLVRDQQPLADLRVYARVRRRQPEKLTAEPL